MQGYITHRKDREGQKGGGVCVFVKETISGHQVHSNVSTKFMTSSPVESLWVDITIDSRNFLLACIYRPKLSTTVEDNNSLIDTLTRACKSNIPVYIFGDFNYPEIDWQTLLVSPTNACSTEFVNAYSEMNAYQLITFPTRIRGDEQSLLDLLLVNEKNLIYNINKHPPVGRSDHVVITANTQLQLSAKSTHKVKKRYYWSANYAAINEYLENQPCINNPDITYEQFIHTVNLALDRFIPLRSKVVNPQKPWLNATIYKQIQKKRKLWDRYRKLKTENSYLLYRIQNNSLKQLIHQAIVDYEQNLLISGDKLFYAYINRTLNSRLSNFSLKASDSVVTDETLIAERFAEQFQTIFTKENMANIPSLPPTSYSASALKSIIITPERVEDAISTLKPNSSPGEDGIPAIFLQKCASTLSYALSSIMNNVLKEGKLPECWKSAIVIPIYKKGDKQQPENYRPISLTSNICKCMEKIIVSAMTPFLLENTTIPDSQHGFLPGRSTTSNLLTRIRDWSLAYDRGDPIDIFYLDFEKAFDKVPFTRLLHKLDHNGIRGPLLNFIKDFLSNRHYQVRIGTTSSMPREVLSGVPQGSVLGPLLFLVYISDLPKKLRCNVSSFADDTNCSCNPATHHADLQCDIDTIKTWTIDWQMPLNDNKCTLLHLGYNNPRYQYTIDENEVRKVKEQRDLGVLLCEDFKWATHINTIIKKTNSLIYLITKAFKNLTPEMVRKLHKTYIRPKLEYAQCIWSPYYIKDIEALERVQRRLTKIPAELKDLPYEQRLERLNLPTLQKRRLRGDLIETYKIITGHYKCSMDFYTFSENQQLRGHNKKLVKERCSKLLRRNFLSNRVVYNWNRLSEETVNATSVNQFKNRLDKEMENWDSFFIHYML